MEIKIRNRWTNVVIHEGNHVSLREAVATAIKVDVNLSGADLRSANLSGANLSGADLRSADLRSANLSGANLSDVNLSDVNLSGADLRSANLSDVNLSDVNLSGADLRSANLSDVNLSDVNLSGADGLCYAQVSFSGHGECGRMLTAIKRTEEIELFCGCFTGNVEALRQYIANGKERLKKTRTLALDTVLVLLEATNETD